jgi:parallel beta-helix repeat protein
MRRIILAVMLALVIAAITGGTAFASFASAKPKGHVVRPGQSIQKAINAADPGDTIVVSGVHHEDVVIRKNGIKLVGDNAVLKPPATGKSKCNAGICVLGDVDFHTGKVSGYVQNVSVIGFTTRNFKDFGIVAFGAQDARFMKNRAFDNGEYGITAFSSSGTKIIANLTSGSGEAGIYVGDSPHADATVAANETYNNLFGILVRNALHGKITANQVHNNCDGMLFLADAPGPAGVFDVMDNKVWNNTRACPATEETPPISGIGIALLGARGVQINGNQIIHNVPSGPTKPPFYSGGVVVVSSFKGTLPTNNTVTGNTILRNKPDILWDKSGSGNRLKPNNCKTSKPGRLCEG